MSQIRISSLFPGLLMSLALFLVSGCGDKNSQADLDPLLGTHSAEWLPLGHKNSANENIEACTECHGSDFSGGISTISCTKCHLGDYRSVHPIEWGNDVIARHKYYATQNGTTSCANIYCHGADLSGVVGSGPSCSSCH